MLGYCSNSPLRCTKARSLEVLNSIDSCCPECHLFLLPAQDVNQQLRTDEKFLRLAVLMTALILFILSYVYYLNFL